jgi:hypothetical protein
VVEIREIRLGTHPTFDSSPLPPEQNINLSNIVIGGKGIMLKHSRPETIFEVFRIPFVVNLVAAGALLVREVLLGPRPYQIVLIVLSCFVFVLVLPQIATGYYFAFDGGIAAVRVVAVIAYVVLMVLTVSGTKMAWGLNRIVGVFGLATPVLIAAVVPEVLVVGLIVTFGFYNNNPTFQGRVSPSLSYRVAINKTFGGGTYYRYTLFRNPQRLPLVRKQIAEGAIYGCEVPAQEVSLKSGTQSGFVHIACQPTSGRVHTGEIPLDHPSGYIVLTAAK